MSTIEPIVVRPSGVWNSRSPFNDYILIARKIQRTHSATALAAQYLFDQMNLEEDRTQSVERFMCQNTSDHQRRGKFARMYYKSFGTKSGKEAAPQTIQTLCFDRELIELGAVQLATLQLIGALETYVQCWFLNLCLSKIENGEGLSEAENKLIACFNPAKQKIAPNLATIINRHSFLEEVLNKIPPFRRHPKTRKEVFMAESPKRSALLEIKYWREYRNLLVHSNGLCSPKFYGEFNEYHSYKRSLSPRLPKLEKMRPLPIDENMFSTQAACFYSVVSHLRNELLTESRFTENGVECFQRGHRLSPGPRGDGGKDTPSPPMFLDGDHELSCRWTSDPAFRAEISAQRKWKYLNLSG